MGRREGNRRKEWKKYGREGEAGTVNLALIGHFLCHSDSSYWGKVGGREGKEDGERKVNEGEREHKYSGRPRI